MCLLSLVQKISRIQDGVVTLNTINQQFGPMALHHVQDQQNEKVYYLHDNFDAIVCQNAGGKLRCLVSFAFVPAIGGK